MVHASDFGVTNQSQKILVLGDSLSAGYGLSASEGWVALWQARLTHQAANIQIINASISGETTQGGLARLPALLAQHQPQWLVIELGANDALRGQNLTKTERNLQQMIALAQAAHSQVMLLGIRLPTNYGVAYDQRLQTLYQQLAQQHALLFDPFFLQDVVLVPDMIQADGLHPTAQAQPIIMNRINALFLQKHQSNKR